MISYLPISSRANEASIYIQQGAEHSSRCSCSIATPRPGDIVPCLNDIARLSVFVNRDIHNMMAAIDWDVSQIHTRLTWGLHGRLHSAAVVARVLAPREEPPRRLG